MLLYGTNTVGAPTPTCGVCLNGSASCALLLLVRN